MRINNNISAMNTHRNMGVNNNATSKSMEKLSSGMRINRAGDDAAGLSISEKMRAQIAGLSQAASNAQDGISYIQTAEGALTEVSSMLTRMKELSVQRSNGTYNTEDIQNIDLELRSLSDEIGNIIATTEFNGMNVFTEDVTITISHDAGVSLDIAAATLDDGGDVDLNDMFTSLGLDPGADAATNAGEAVEVGNIDIAIDLVNSQRAIYGAAQNRLEHTINNLGTTHENLSAAESRIRDTDMAKEMTEFTKNNILQQAAQSMLAQANQLPQNVLGLLR